MPCAGRRTRPSSGSPGVSPACNLSAADFEVFRTETLTKTSTVLLVAMSRSMLLRGCFLAAKKVAVALDTLIRTQFPHDDLTVIGFAYYARELRPEALAELTWHGYEYGNEPPARADARSPDPRPAARRDAPGRRDHRRRADRPRTCTPAWVLILSGLTTP